MELINESGTKKDFHKKLADEFGVKDAKLVNAFDELQVKFEVYMTEMNRMSEYNKL